MGPDQWIHHVDQPPPPDLDRRLRDPDDRLFIVAAAFSHVAEEWFRNDIRPDVVVITDGPVLKVLCTVEGDYRAVFIDAWWWWCFPEAFTDEMVDGLVEAKAQPKVWSES